MAKQKCDSQFHDFVDIKEFAEEKGIPAATIRSWANRKQLPLPFYKSDKIHLFERSELESAPMVGRWLNKQKELEENG